jgi:hypothetical protein
VTSSATASARCSTTGSRSSTTTTPTRPGRWSRAWSSPSSR